MIKASLPREIAVTPEISAMLAAGAVVAIGVSSGKDSAAAAHAMVRYLDSIGHTGPRVLVHADLGRVEWKQSLPGCEALAKRLGMELLVVRRQAGDLLARWEVRWSNCAERYRTLACMKLILPWSTAAMRFCTSEMKISVISQGLTKLFPGQTILSVTGVRHEESPARAKMPIVSTQGKLSSRGCTGYNWNPIITWSKDEVLDFLEAVDEPLHEAYRVYGSTRLSCAFCILASGHDLRAAADCADNADIYRSLVDLEIRSTFGFQGNRWLADVAPELLTPEVREAVVSAKARAARRQAAEALIPKDLLFTSDGWPPRLPTREEAEIIAGVRRDVAAAVGIEALFTTGDAVLQRFAELMADAA